MGSNSFKYSCKITVGLVLVVLTVVLLEIVTYMPSDGDLNETLDTGKGTCVLAHLCITLVFEVFLP